MTMKKQYIAPQMETGGGGEAGSRLFDESELELFQNDDLEMIYKELGM